MNPESLGPLFVPPWMHAGIGGLQWLPIVVIAPAVLILLWGLLSGRLPVPLAAAGIVVFPLAGFGFGSLLMFEDSMKTEFCASCHLMTPILETMKRPGEDTLAAIHYQRGLVPQTTACYQCHSGYGIRGGVDAKMAGVGHMVRTVTRRYELPLKLAGTFNIDSCLSCHAGTTKFREVEEHRDPDLQKALISREVGCTGDCHPQAHPDDALNGPASATAAAR